MNQSVNPAELVNRFGIGASLSRFEDLRLTRGAGRYTDDIHFHGEATMLVVRSTHAAARIAHMDTTAAAEIAGVLAIYTGKDVAADGLGHVTTAVPRQRPNGEPMIQPPYPLLAENEVRFVGDAVAVVIAEDAFAAQEAADIIVIDYEDRPSATVLADALKPDAPKVWPGLVDDNISYLLVAGNKKQTDAAFVMARHTVKCDLRVTRVHAVTLEPRGAIGLYDPIEDRYTLYAGTQSPHIARAELSRAILGVPLHKLRVVSPDMGGGFGIRGGSYPEYGLVLWAAKKLKRPVRWQSTRSEAFLSDYHGRDSIFAAELALAEDGTFLAVRVSAIANCGAYLGSTTPLPPGSNIAGLMGVYRTPNAYAEICGVHTNTQPLCPYRGAGRPEAIYVMERLIDEAASRCGFDRLELRRKNMIAASAMPFATPLGYTYDCGEFEKGMNMALEAADWAGFAERRATAASAGKLRGISIVNTIEIAGGPHGRPPEEFAEIKFDAGGNATILTGGHNHGQGHETSYRQVVISQLGLEPNRTRVVFGDTDVVDHGLGTHGSRSMTAAGNALVHASKKIVERGRDIAANLLEASLEDVQFEAGTFRVAGTDRLVRIEDVARASYSFQAMPKGEELGLSARAIVSPADATYPNGCHICEVEIDPETGTTEVVNYVIVDDVGTMINPMLVKGQLYGGAIQGLGQAFFETIEYDHSNGQLITASFMDYAVPRAGDAPAINVLTNPVPTAKNPLGVKGAGEAGTVGALPAVTMAVLDALRPLGVQHFDMPATSERVWRAIREAEVKRGR